MSINHELIPKRRFKEFENADAWEQRKFGNIIQIERGGSPRPIEEYITTSSDGLNWVKIGDAPEQGNYITSTSEKIRPEGLSKTREVYPGDLILSNSMSFGKPYIMAIKGCIHDGWLLLRDKNNYFDLIFLCNLLGTPQMLQQYKGLAAGSTVNNLNKELVSSTQVCIPNIEEQKPIGIFFETIDNLITLHQRKLSKLRILKSAYLSEIIPEEGKLNPKRRFPGFTEDWEKKKISDMFKVTRGQVLSMSLTSPIKDETNKYPVYSSQTKNDGLMGYYSEYLFDTAITWTTDGANAGTVNFRKGKFFSTNVNGVLLSNDGYCNKAVSEILNLVTYKYVSKVGNPKLMNNVMEEIIISVPKDKNEMKIISDFLMTFDKRINYLEEKIKKIEDLKRSYLNEMFV